MNIWKIFLFAYLYTMSKNKDGKYRYLLILDGRIEPMLKKVAKKNKHTINDEIAIVVEKHVNKEIKTGK